jgi:hypothetical protein
MHLENFAYMKSFKKFPNEKLQTDKTQLPSSKIQELSASDY